MSAPPDVAAAGRGLAAPLRRVRARLLDRLAEEMAACAAETGRGCLSPRVLAALHDVPRHAFVPALPLAVAYLDEPLPIGHGQTISQPFIVALMTELADIGPDDAVLEIGTGSGYQAAILSRLARRVDSVECVPELAETARLRLAELGFPVAVHAGDGREGHRAGAPYDAIIVTAASADIPPELVGQLRVGGRLVMPLGGPSDAQVLIRAVKREDGTLESRRCLDVRFVPLVAASPAAAAAGTAASPLD